MPYAYFRISATTGCVPTLNEALRELPMIRDVQRVVSGSCDFYVLVLGEMSELIDFKDKTIAGLTAVVYDAAEENATQKPMVHRVEVDVLYPDEDSVSACVVAPPKTLS